MIPHLQRWHVAEIGYMNDNEAKSQIKFVKITGMVDTKIRTSENTIHSYPTSLENTLFGYLQDLFLNCLSQYKVG